MRSLELYGSYSKLVDRGLPGPTSSNRRPYSSGVLGPSPPLPFPSPLLLLRSRPLKSLSYVGLVAVGVQEQAEDILVPPLLRNCLTFNYIPLS